MTTTRNPKSQTFQNVFVRNRLTSEIGNFGRLGCACYVPIGDSDYDMSTDTTYFGRTLLRAEPTTADRTVTFSTAQTAQYPDYYEGMVKVVINAGTGGHLLTVNSLEGQFPTHTLSVGEMLTTVLSGGQWLISESGDSIWSYDIGTNTISPIPAGASVSITPGDLTVDGKLTVTGLIDPIGVVIDEQAVVPTPAVAGKGTVWVRNDTPNVLVYTDDTGVDHVLSTLTGGDVVGPAGATDSALAVYDTATGKLLKDSSILVTGTSNLTVPGIATLGGVSYPGAPGTVGYVLTLTGASVATWQPNPSGDVVGPASSVTNSLARYANTTGKLINECPINVTLNDLAYLSGLARIDVAGVLYPTTTGTAGQVLALTGAGTTSAWTTIGGGDVTGPAGVTQYAIARYADVTGKVIDTSVLPVVVTLSNTGVISGLTGLSTSAFTLAGMTFPTAFGTLGQVLTYSGPGTVSWQNASGDVTGPAGATQYALARYSDITGKNLDESVTTVTLSDAGALSGLTQIDVAGVTYPTAVGLAGQVLTLTGVGTTSAWNYALLGIGSSTNNALMRWSGTSGTVPQDSGVILDNTNNMTGVNTINVASTATLGAVAYPVGAGTVGYVLTLTGPNTASWQATGTLTGTGIAQNIARWSGATSLDDSPANVTLNDAGSIAGVLNLTATGVATLGGTALPAATGTAGQVLTISAPGTAIWAATGTVNGPGALPVNYMLTRFADTTGNNIDTSTGTNVTLDNTSHLSGLNDLTTVIAHIGGVAYPNTTGSAGDVLTLTSANVAAWVAATGDVTGPAGATQYSLARYADVTGKIIDETAAVVKVTLDDSGNITGVVNLTATGIATLGGTALPAVTGAAGEVLTISAPGTAVWAATGNISGTSVTVNAITRWASATTIDECPVVVTLSNTGDITGVVNFTASGTASLGGITYPVGAGVTGQVLVLTAPTTLAWGDALLSTGASTDTAIVRWNGTTGSAVQDSGILIDGANNMTGINNLTAAAIATLGGTALPAVTGTAGQVLTISAPGTAIWAATGNISGTSTNATALTRWASPTTIDECPVTVLLSNAGDLTGLNSITTTNATIGTVTYPSAPGTAGYVLTMGGGLNATWQPSGNLSGSSTIVNAIARWSGPSSLDEPATVVPTLTDTGDIAGVATIGVTGVATLGGTALPAVTGTAGQVLTISAPGTATWSTPTIGDVVGPASAVDNHIATFDLTTGKLIQDNSSVAISDTSDITGVATIVVSGIANLGGTALPSATGTAGQALVISAPGTAVWTTLPGGDVTGPASSIDNHVATFHLTSGKIIQDNSPVTIGDTGNVTGVLDITATGTATLGGTTYPSATGSTGQVLTLTAPGVSTWATPTIGDVVGPASAVDNHIVTFNLTTGKLVQDNSSVAISDASDITGVATITVTGVATLGGSAFPASTGAIDQILVADGAGNLVWSSSYGDVDGPASSTINHIALYADTTGKLLKDSSPIVINVGAITGVTSITVTGAATLGGTAFPSVTGTSGQILVADGVGNAAWTTPSYGDVSGPASSTVNHIALYSDTTGKLIKDSSPIVVNLGAVTGVSTIHVSGVATLGGTAFPSVTGTANQILVANGSGTAAWTTPTYGNVSGPASSVDNHIVTFHLTSGKIIQDNTPVSVSDSGNMTGLSNITASGVATLGGTAFPSSTGTSGQLLVADGVGNAAWTTPPYGDVTGPVSSTVNHIALYSDTTGKIIKDSSPIIVNTGSVSGVTSLVVSGTATLGGTAFPSATGTANQILVANGSGAATWTTPAFGDVSRSGTTADNRIARWNGTAASIQNSAVTLNDSGDLSGIRSLYASGGTVRLNNQNWPSTTGTAGYVLTTDGASPATLTWEDPTANYLWQVTTESSTSVLRPQGTGATTTLCFGTPTPYDTGVGTRMWFDTARRAFRGGYTSGTEWQLSNVGDDSFVFGFNNQGSGNKSVIGGGASNLISSAYGTICGGYSSTISGATYATICGGDLHLIDHTRGFIGGGWTNTVKGQYSAVVAGYNNIVSDGTSSGSTEAAYSIVCGGYQNKIESNTAIPGNGPANYCFIGGGYTNASHGDYSLVCGGRTNEASGTNSTICGGRSGTGSGDYSFLGGGQLGISSGNFSVVNGGYQNEARGTNSTVGGGTSNLATYASSTIGGGSSNLTSADYACVPGGLQNEANGEGSFACGRTAKANHDGSFVFGNQNSGDTTSNGPDTVTFAAHGGYRIITGGTSSSPTSGRYMNGGSSDWNSYCDRNLKNIDGEVDYAQILSNVKEFVHVYRYRMKTQSDDTPFTIGTMAQEFQQIVDTGCKDLVISDLTHMGINLALSIALSNELDRSKEEISTLKDENEELKKRLSRIEAALGL